MSARAAWRLTGMGFDHVFRYSAGKADWLANGEPIEGRRNQVAMAGDLARRNPPTCALTDRAGEVLARLRPTEWSACVVVNEERVVLGLLNEAELEGAPSDAIAAEVMQCGPPTFRYDADVQDAYDHMRRNGTDVALVTTSDGRLVGALGRSEAERRMKADSTRSAPGRCE